MRAVPDPRCGRKTKHDHAEILVCLVIGFLAGRTTMRRSLKWCENHLDWLRNHIPLKNGIASLSTASRMLSEIDEELFGLEFMEWIGEILNTRGIHLVIDGKALRGAIDKVRGGRSPMVMNAIDAATGLVLSQIPIQDKDCEITAIPKVLELLDISGSTVTIDAVGTQTEIMKQILLQEGHFQLPVKKNQPQSYEEIMKYFKIMEEDDKRRKKDPGYKVNYPEMQKGYEKIYHQEKNRDRYENRWYQSCDDVSLLSRTREEWPFIKTVGQVRRIRIPIERDIHGTDVTPGVESFLKNGSRRKAPPKADDNERSDQQEVGMISDRKLTAKEMGEISRAHWSIENRLHHVLDVSFREDRSPAKKSKNNLALIRKFSYNILRIAMLSESKAEIMIELMDEFCDDHSLIERYVFNGIASFY